MLGLEITQDLEYLLVFTLVLIFPKVLLRFKIPSGITAISIGILMSYFDPDLQSDTLFKFLSQIGITSLFLFAGLEVEWDSLKKDQTYLSKYIGKTLSILLVISYCISHYLNLPFQESFIYSLGIFTPSAGFILTSMHSFKISENQEYWIKSKAISKELIAIVLLFLALQGSDYQKLLNSLVFFALLFILLPFVFKIFFKFVSPYAPNSKVSFLVVLALIAGVISKELGAYYLVGAFAVGVISGKFKAQIFKEGEDNMLHSLSSFFTTFLPFYFFYAGMKIIPQEVTISAFLYGLLLIALFIPLRLFVISNSMSLFMKDKKIRKSQITLSLMPTLIFGLVIAGILKDRGIISTDLIYALLVYTLINSLIPSITLAARKKIKKY